jgi:hypothetical protein
MGMMGYGTRFHDELWPEGAYSGDSYTGFRGSISCADGWKRVQRDEMLRMHVNILLKTIFRTRRVSCGLVNSLDIVRTAEATPAKPKKGAKGGQVDIVEDSRRSVGRV